MPKVAVLYDVEGWATHRHAMGLQKYAPVGYEVEIAQIGSTTDEWHATFDAVYTIYLASAGKNASIKRIASCVAAHAWTHPVYIEDDWRTRGVNQNRNCKQGQVLVDRLDACICRNNALTKWASQFNANCRTIPAGVDTDMFHPRGRNHNITKLRVGWSGQVANEPTKDFKGYNDILLPLMARLGSRFDWHVNTNTYQDCLTPEQMAEWYRGCDVFLTTSPVDGTPNVVFEAAGSGCCVLSTDMGQVADWNTMRGLGMIGPSYHNSRTAAKTIDWFADQLTTLDGDYARCVELGLKLRASIEAEYDYRIIAPRTLRFVVGEN